MALAACGAPRAPQATPTQTSNPSPTGAPTPLPPETLRVWLPPIGGLPSRSPAAEMLTKRIEAFAASEGLKAEIRIKPLSGPAGMLNTLAAARQVAPAAVPDVVLIPRSLMEEAVANGLAFPLPDNAFTTPLSTGDWFGYAQQMAAVQSVSYGVPFAGDAFGVVYNPRTVKSPPQTWGEWLKAKQPWRIALGDQRATSILALYKTAGGTWQSQDGAPQLDEKTLARVFSLLQSANANGLLSAVNLQFKNDEELWKKSRGESDAFILTYASHLLSAPAPRQIAPIPGPDVEHRTILSTAWLWTLTTPDSNRQRIAVKFLAYMGDAEFVSRWTESAGYLPPRRVELNTWGNARQRALAASVMPFLTPPPPAQVETKYGAALAEAARRVLNGDLTSQEAAHWAIAEAAKP